MTDAPAPDPYQYAVRNEYGDVFPADTRATAEYVCAQDTDLTPVRRPAVQPWLPVPPPADDRQQVQSRRATSLAAIQQAKYPRDALYALLRAANQDVLHLLATKGLESDGEFTVTVEVCTTARPQGSPDA